VLATEEECDEVGVVGHEDVAVGEDATTTR